MLLLPTSEPRLSRKRLLVESFRTGSLMSIGSGVRPLVKTPWGHQLSITVCVIYKCDLLLIARIRAMYDYQRIQEVFHPWESFFVAMGFAPGRSL